MESSYRTKIICKFCGKEREYVTVHDDGTDFYGHARGRVFNQTIDDGCDCPLGKIEHEHQQIKKMCMNCKNKDGMYCINKNMINKISNIFNMPEKLEIKDRTKSCENWELDTEIFKCLVK